jgi:hypothetical protein
MVVFPDTHDAHQLLLAHGLGVLVDYYKITRIRRNAVQSRARNTAATSRNRCLSLW